MQTITLTPPAGLNEPALTVTFSDAAMQEAALAVRSIPASGIWPNTPATVPLSTTLTAPLSVIDTTGILGTSANIAVCNGLLIDGEVMLVTGINPLTVQRGMVGTTPATHAAGTPVTVLRAGGFVAALKAIISDGSTAILVGALNATAQAQSQAALAAQMVANAAAAAAGVL